MQFFLSARQYITNIYRIKKLQSKDETFLEAFTQCDFGGQSWKHLKGFGYQYLMSGQIGLHYPNTTAV